jgi:uncharacterized protein YneF (UPF0154 family)
MPDESREEAGSVEPVGLDPSKAPAEDVIDEASDDIQPAGHGSKAPGVVQLEPDRDAQTRTWLAVALTGLLALLAGVAAYGWLIMGKQLDELQAYMLVVSPIVTLTGTILGFYFSQRRRQ